MDSYSTGYQGGEEEAKEAYSASKASVEGEAPSGFAGGGGDASPYGRRAGDEANAGSRMKTDPNRPGKEGHWHDKRAPWETRKWWMA